MAKKPQLPWSIAQEECLLTLVKSQGLHLLKGTGGIDEKWEKLFSNMFLNHEFAAYKESHYSAGQSRKIRIKYEKDSRRCSKRYQSW